MKKITNQADTFPVQHFAIEPRRPTIASVVPMKCKRWTGFLATNEVKAHLLKLNSQTPCPPRSGGSLAIAASDDGSRLTKGVAGGSLTLATRFAFGHGFDRSSYVKLRLAACKSHVNKLGWRRRKRCRSHRLPTTVSFARGILRHEGASTAEMPALFFVFHS